MTKKRPYKKKRSGSKDRRGPRKRPQKKDRSPDHSQLEGKSGYLGILELNGKGSGFVRCREASYLPSDCDVHVGRQLIQEYGMRTGDEITGVVGQAPGRGKSPPLTTVEAINGRQPHEIKGRPEFSRHVINHYRGHNRPGNLC